MPQPIPFQPSSYTKRILLSVIGLTPQVITETIYALSQQNDTFIPTELHVITTQEGYDRTRLTLLGDQTGWLMRLCQDYQLPSIQFNESHIHVLTGASGALTDIRTESDNQVLADTIVDYIARFTADENTALHVSIAGGRKTMGYYAGYALSLFGRPQDRLSHVLVSEDFEFQPDFFYPTPYSRVIFKSSQNNKPLDTKDAKVSLADIPFVRLRHELPHKLLNGDASFSATVESAQAALSPIGVVLNVANKTLIAGNQHILLSPVNLAFYWLMLAKAMNSAGGIHYKTTPDLHIDFLQYYAELIGKHHGEFTELETKLMKQDGIDKEWFDERISRIKKAFVNAFGVKGASPYLPTTAGRNQPRMLTLPKTAITIVKE